MITAIDATKDQRTLEELLKDQSLIHVDCDVYHLVVSKVPAEVLDGGQKSQQMEFFAMPVRESPTSWETGRLLSQVLKEDAYTKEKFLSDLKMSPFWINTAVRYGREGIRLVEAPEVSLKSLSIEPSPRPFKIDGLYMPNRPSRCIKYSLLENINDNKNTQMMILEEAFGTSGLDAVVQLSKRCDRKDFMIYLNPEPPNKEITPEGVLTLPMTLFSARSSRLHIDFEYTQSHAKAYAALRRSLRR